MILAPFEPEHLRLLALQSEQEYFKPYIEDPSYGKYLQIGGKCYSFLDGDRVLACAGVIPLWDGRGEAWSLLGGDLRKYFLQIHYTVKRFLASCDMKRIEANVSCDSERARKWVESLGFSFEGRMAAFWPDGRDAARYARVL